mmetsp:Transcript_4776/g.10081  ORF Transcript_4776/g.10081 Transcript_4776/m.10081 type:complete len:228 (+) Transcript_4776:125-808(+)|eukprot:CAMPEP_0194342586 /NCGR_PEP_ID=MMETSP0171-20130528/93433_1 /TAXON_ID=218684 /ORGANISM="Corethron pennatum, Strain L29A3" /LENGTH=227 /DNA_ID=CAMNT_0039108401 /DNA_START=97 /DNA_END=780 /DNA_ORIENTATION=-
MTETIAIFGATGGYGSEITATALDQGYLVRVMVRNPSKLPGEIRRNPNLTVLKGDIISLETIRETVLGADYVINAVGGPVGKPQVFPIGRYAGFVRDLVGIMKETPSVKVFLHESGCLTADPDGTQPLSMKIMGVVLGYCNGIGPNTDEHFMEQQYLESVREDVSFKTICIRPGGLQKGEGGAELVASESPSGLAFGMTDFKDLGVFTVRALKDESLYGKYPYVVKA